MGPIYFSLRNSDFKPIAIATIAAAICTMCISGAIKLLSNCCQLNRLPAQLIIAKSKVSSALIIILLFSCIGLFGFNALYYGLHGCYTKHYAYQATEGP